MFLIQYLRKVFYVKVFCNKEIINRYFTSLSSFVAGKSVHARLCVWLFYRAGHLCVCVAKCACEWTSFVSFCYIFVLYIFFFKFLQPNILNFVNFCWKISQKLLHIFFFRIFDGGCSWKLVWVFISSIRKIYINIFGTEILCRGLTM